jgi:hypothetical protein
VIFRYRDNFLRKLERSEVVQTQLLKGIVAVLCAVQGVIEIDPIVFTSSRVNCHEQCFEYNLPYEHVVILSIYIGTSRPRVVHEMEGTSVFGNYDTNNPIKDRDGATSSGALRQKMLVLFVGPVLSSPP